MIKNSKYGTKIECSNCGIRFFDLNQVSIICPKCEYIYPTTEKKSSTSESSTLKNKIIKSTNNIETINNTTNTNNKSEFVSVEDADTKIISELTNNKEDTTTTPDENISLEEDETKNTIK